MYYTNVANLGNNILFRGIENGKRVASRAPYKPTLHIKENRKRKGPSTSKWKTLQGEGLEAIQLDGIYDAREFLKKYKDVENFDVFGQTFFQYAYISEFFGKKFQFDITDIVIATIDIEVGSENGFPEPAQAYEPITAITLHIHNKFQPATKTGKYYVFGCGDYTNTRDDVEYFKCEDEQELILRFLATWESHYPDIVTGWNIQKFDFPYIINRMNRIFMEEHVKRLSPWSKIQDREVFDKGGVKKVQVYEIYGISIIDYIDLYKKYSSNANQESYRLDHIAFVELGEKKLDYSEYGNLYNLYKRDYQRFIDYNIQDVTLVIRINDKIRLLELAITLAYDNKVNFSDVFSQVRMWDCITSNHLLQKGIVVPPKKTVEKKPEFAGAYVKDPEVGRHQYVASVDLDGLYPHLIMMYNLGPETLVNPATMPTEFKDWFMNQRFSVEALLEQKIDTQMLKKYNLSVTANGQLFKRDKQGFFAELMETMYADRKNFKNQMIESKKKLEKTTNPSEREVLTKQIAMLNNFQLAKKVTLNSAYGAIGNQYFRFFDVRIAEAVTISGQLAIRWIQKEINVFLNKLAKTNGFDYVIASDTDSMYLNLLPLVERAIPDHKNWERIKVIRELDKLVEDMIQPFIKEAFARLDDYVNAYASKMSMKREALADVAIWTGKKHYLMSVWNLEGVEYDKPKLKITGLEAVKAGSLSTEARDKIKQAYEIIVADDIDKLRKFKDEYFEQFKKKSVESIALPRGCNGLTKYADDTTIWGFKTPFHVKGALVYNDLLKKLNLTKKYESIKEGDKVKYLYLKEPNPTQTNVIAFPQILPKEFDLHKYVDYNMQFDKCFVDPVTSVLDAIGWKFVKTNTLFD